MRAIPGIIELEGEHADRDHPEKELDRVGLGNQVHGAVQVAAGLLEEGVEVRARLSQSRQRGHVAAADFLLRVHFRRLRRCKPKLRRVHATDTDTNSASGGTSSEE